jgi:sugar phosphate isomerase/epimerase
MHIICASICYRGYEADEVAATLKYAPALGYKYMEIHGPLVWSVEAAGNFDLDGIRAAVQASGMTCAGLYPPGWGGKHDAEVTAHAHAIARCVEYTRQLGGSHISTSGAEPHGTPGAIERVIECARQVLDLVPQDTPIKLTMEPHFGNVLQDWADFARIVEAIPDQRLGVCVDTGHFHSAGVNTADFIREFAPRIYAVHLKDHLGTVSVGIGRGEIDLRREIEALEDIGYEGGLTIELEVEDPQNLPKYTEEAYLYVSGLLGTKL